MLLKALKLLYESLLYDQQYSSEYKLWKPEKAALFKTKDAFAFAKDTHLDM